MPSDKYVASNDPKQINIQCISNLVSIDDQCVKKLIDLFHLNRL